MRRPVQLLLIAYCLSLTSLAQQRDFTRWVNPLIGTGGHGHTFPGATRPFGMVQLSPDTRIDNWDGSSGYHYSDDVIYGFSHTHLSGTGIPDGCDILFMPTVRNPGYFSKMDQTPLAKYTSKFSHANEKAEPGYYSVKLDDSEIVAELTATKRVGLHRYTFPKSDTANIIFDLNWRDRVIASEIQVVSSSSLEGFRRSTSWAKDQVVYFAVEFSKPMTYYQVRGDSDGRDRAATGPNVKSVLRFSTGSNEQILVKVAISYVSTEGARKNLEAELPHWDFDKVRADAKAAWNKELSKIEVSGGTDEQTTNFYTALYHTMIHPNVFNDVDGSYRGHDGKIHVLSPGSSRPVSTTPESVHSAPKPGTQNVPAGNPKSKIQNPKSAEHYTVFSLWDTFRAAHPLYTIIDQKRTVDFINTFIRIYEQGGRLPVWELWGEETDTMIGYHAVSVIADAMAKDIKGFDYEKAYAAAKHSAELDHFGLAGYKRRGYVSTEDDNESASKTLEYAYNDWCLMKMGSTLFNMRSFGKAGTGSIGSDPYLKKLSEEIEHYKRRSGNFANLFDTETRFFRPRVNGGFVKPFAPQEVTFYFTEGNSWQYSFFVPHDVERLMHLMGGTTKFLEKLDELFTTETKLSGREQPDITGLMGQYAHGNEPSHHIAYLYNYAAAPSKTQHRVRRIMDEFYKPTPDGLIGNEDCGQMSAWYVLSASGFYPVVPGEKRYDLGTPLFKQIVFNLENGKKFIIRAPKVSQTSIYVNSARWNGVAHPASYITQDHMMAGGVLELDMSARPNDKAFDSFSSSSVYRDWLTVPVIEGPRVFKDKTTVTITTLDRYASIMYAVYNERGDVVQKAQTYTGPFRIDATTRVEAFATDPKTGVESKKVEALFSRRRNDWTVKIASPYSYQYTGGGDGAIVDGLRGTTNFASGEWQGYQGKTFEAVIDLQRETEIREVGGSFLQVARSWIWMPDRVDFEVSIDGVQFTRVAEIRPRFPQQEMNPVMKEFTQPIAPARARYIRVRAHNFGKIPSWHPGAGGDPWIFVDEILIGELIVDSSSRWG
ncbi:MAG TPA: GH92 family glycosyl hydrolase [Pyrinomonadaceae bacterium]